MTQDSNYGDKSPWPPIPVTPQTPIPRRASRILPSTDDKAKHPLTRHRIWFNLFAICIGVIVIGSLVYIYTSLYPGIIVFLVTIKPATVITVGFAIYIAVLTLILRFHISRKARISLILALIIFLLGINLFVSWLDWHSQQNHQNLYARATSGALALYDPLTKDSNNQWIKSSKCQFTGGSYHVSSSHYRTLILCPALATNFKNFAYQVRIIILRGDDGCIGFRFNITNKETDYEFCIGSNSSYVLLVKKPNDNYYTNLQEGFNPAVNKGLNQLNTIAVVARGTELDMYVNTLFVSSVNDNTSTQGFIVLGAYDVSSSSEVAFSNAQVWTL